MELKIEGKTLIRDIQREFSSFYEFLKIEFFRHPHNENVLSPNTEKIGSGETISHLCKTGIPGVIDTGIKRTVAELEADFRNKYGLFVQVYRKAGHLWIETSKSDHWTLGAQNEEGRESCTRSSGKKSFDENREDSLWDS